MRGVQNRDMLPNFKKSKPDKDLESHTLGLSYTQTTVVLGAMRGVQNRDMQLLIVAESVKICGNACGNIDHDDLKRKRDCWKVESNDSKHLRSKNGAPRTVAAQTEPSKVDVTDNLKVLK